MADQSDDRVLETRRNAMGFKARRYQRGDGSRYNTIEVPREAWEFLLQGSGARRNQLDTLLLRVKLVPRLLAGEKPLALSHETGVPLRTLERWRFNARKAQGKP